MKCLLIYYSLTGSTGRIAEHIALGLDQAAVDVSLCNIKAERPPDLALFDLIGFGSPVYYFQVPINVLECIESLSNPKNVPAFVFMTNGTYAWNAGDGMEKALLKAGFQVSGWFYSHGAGYFYEYNKLGCLASPESPTGEELANAQAFGYDMASAACAAKWQKKSQAPPIVYRFEQFLTQRSLVRSLFQKLFYLDKEKCIKCGICIKGCPVQNLEQTPEGYPHWKRSCIMCLSCEANCPKEAIRSPVSWPIMKPLIRYNVHQITKDPELEKVKVQHHNGKLEVIE